MKKNIKKLIIAGLALFLLSGQSALAYVSWNTDPQDCPGSGIGNYTTGVGIPTNGTSCWNLTNVSGSAGNSINVQLYYHNTGNEPATNTVVQISVSPAIGQTALTHTFTSNLTSSQGGKFLGTTTLTLSSPASLSFGSTYWYPNQGSTYYTSGTQIINGGLSLGTINPGWPSQGSTVTSFIVNSTPVPNCSINSFTASPTTITAGQSSTLFWNTSNCTSASITPTVGNVYPVSSGSQSVSPTTTTTYVMTATGANGIQATKNVTVNVNQAQNCTINSFNVTPQSITSGQSVNVSWNTSNCVSVNVSGSNFSSNSLSGNQTAYPVSSGNYTISAQGTTGYVAPQSIYVSVNNAQTTGTLTPASQSCTILSGQSSCTIPFSWNVVNPPAGSQTAVTQSGGGTVATGNSGNQSFTIPHGGATFYLYNNAVLLDQDSVTSSCASGTSWNGNSCAPVQTCSISSFTASPMTISQGQSSTLSWTTTGNCTSASISPIGGTASLPSGSALVFPTTTTTYTLSVYGPGFWQAQTQSVTITVNNTAQSCAITSFNSNPSSVTSGQSSSLSWTTSGTCVSASISPNVGMVNLPSGSQVVNPTNTTTYTLTVIGSNGNPVSQTTTVTVNQSQGCSITSFTANPSTITSGQNSILSWATSGNCLSATISPNIGVVNVQSGSQQVSPTSTTTYTLSVTGASGSYVAPQSVTVNVNQVPSCTVSYFTVNGASTATVQSGNSVNIAWSTNNCTSVNVSGPNFSSTSTNYSSAIYPTSSGTYTLTATNSNGTSINPQTVYVNVTNNQTNNCYINSFTVNGSSSVSIQSGNSVNIYWSTSGTNCNANVSGPNFSSSSLSGSQTIYPTYSGTYTLSLSGNNWGTQTQSVYVNVTNNQYQYNNCVISYFNVTPNTINYGNVATLTWSTSNCSAVSISNIGNVNSYGSQNVYPSTTTNYVLSAYNYNGPTMTQMATVTVANYVPPTPNPINNSCAVTTVPTNITKNSVTLNGLITSSNYISNTHFEYGTDVNMNYQTAPKIASSNTTFSDTLTGLTPDTIYFYRLVSNCGGGNSYGSTEVFQTLSGTTTNERIIIQGQTVVGAESPILLKIENEYQAIRVGDTINYTVTYQNIGSKKLSNALLQVILPKGIAFVKSSRGTYSSNTYTLSVPLGDLLPKDSGQVYLTANVDSLSAGNAQVVTTALLVYTNAKVAQENAMAYVMNTPSGGNFNLGALALFGWFYNIGIIGWLLIIIIILLLILILRRYFTRKNYD